MQEKLSNVVGIVQPAVSAETVEAIEFPLAEARAGHIIGLAWISLHPGDQYRVDVVGEAGRQPVFVRGTLPVLDDELAKIIGSR